MTGWRLGTTVAPAPIAKAIAELQSQMTSNATTFAQYGAVAALKEKEKTDAALKTMLVAFDRRRKFLHAELNKIPGIKCLLAEGAFYLFPNISSFGLSSADFCAKLLEAEKVAAVMQRAASFSVCAMCSPVTIGRVSSPQWRRVRQLRRNSAMRPQPRQDSRYVARRMPALRAGP